MNRNFITEDKIIVEIEWSEEYQKLSPTFDIRQNNYVKRYTELMTKQSDNSEYTELIEDYCFENYGVVPNCILNHRLNTSFGEESIWE